VRSPSLRDSDVHYNRIPKGDGFETQGRARRLLRELLVEIEPRPDDRGLR